MDLEVLKKRISSFRTEGGHLTKVSDEILIEVLMAWEQWTGPAKGFYSAIGVNQYKMAGLIGKAKRLKREGRFPTEEFKEIKVENSPSNLVSLQSGPCSGVEILWDNGKLIRFSHVEQLVDFLKKVA